MSFSTLLELNYQQIFSILHPDNLVLFGIGNTSSWPIEGTPPPVDPSSPSQSQVIGYVRISTKKTATRTLSSGNFTAGGLNYITSSNVSINDIRNGSISKVFLEASISHDDLNALNYRSLSVFINPVLDDGVDTQKSFYLPNEIISGYPIYLEFFPPVTVQPSTTILTQRVISIF